MENIGTVSLETAREWAHTMRMPVLWKALEPHEMAGQSLIVWPNGECVVVGAA